MELKINCIFLGLLLFCFPPSCLLRLLEEAGCPSPLNKSQSQKVLSLIRYHIFWGWQAVCTKVGIQAMQLLTCRVSSLFSPCKLNIAGPQPSTWPGLGAASSSIYTNPIPASLLTVFATKPFETFLSYLSPTSPLLQTSHSWPWVEEAY